ncbi:MAG: SRPBCC family protein [Actinomycetota bacterium]|nr:SRPBCC family protein [Actinomycetota bacterium]
MKVARTRKISAPAEAVWKLVSDPHSLPRWWPKVMRVEDVTGQGKRSRWTAVLKTDKGNSVRADFRCTASTEEERYAWSQDLAGTAFERILSQAGLEITLVPEGSGQTTVRLTSEESLRGLSRLGSPMMRGAVRRRLDDAFDGIERALVGDGAP